MTECGSAKSRPVGVVWSVDWCKRTDKDVPISSYMSVIPATASSSYDFEQIVDHLSLNKIKCVATLTEESEIVDFITESDIERIRGLPKLGVPSLGSDGKFLVGAAIGTREQDKERLEHLVNAGANVVILDSSQGNSIYQIEMIKHVKRNYPELDVIGGNVVTAYQAENLIQAGADGLRVGMGSGSICTTQEVCAVGRGQVFQFPLPVNSNAFQNFGAFLLYTVKYIRACVQLNYFYYMIFMSL